MLLGFKTRNKHNTLLVEAELPGAARFTWRGPPLSKIHLTLYFLLGGVPLVGRVHCSYEAAVRRAWFDEHGTLLILLVTGP